MQLTKHYRYMLLLLFLSLFIMTACGAQPELYSEQVVDVGVQVFVFPGGTEKRLISDEKIEQDNCNGSAETSQTVTRQHTVQYTMEVGSGLTVNAEGKVGVPGVGEVGVGTEVATHYKVGYGRQEAVTRSQTVAASPNSHIQHTIQQFEIWETGEVLIVAGDQNQRLPYSFRRDFSIEAVAPANIGCPGTSSNSISDSTAIPPVTQALTTPPQNDLVTTVATTSPPDQLINLVQNPSFENGTQGWEFSDQIELVSGNSGATALQSTKSTDSAWGWVGLAQEIPVNPGHQYSFTAYFKLDKCNSIAYESDVV